MIRAIRFLPACVAVLVLIPNRGKAQARFFPDVASFEFPLASPRLAGFAGRIIDERFGDDQFGAERKADVSIGEDFPIFALRKGPQPITLGFGVEVSGRFSLQDSKSAMISNDWMVGINTHFDISPWELDVQLYHESSHLGDEYADTFGAERIDWTREVFALWVGYRTGAFRLMGSTGSVLKDELALPRWIASVGLDFRGNGFTLFGQRAYPIAGVFTEAASATVWRLSHSAKFGLAFPGAREGKELRLSIVGHDGLSTQRQFFRHPSRYIGMEIELQL
jgi:hypothetical protein